ncbi:chromosome maintenance protein (SMC5 homologue), putative [Theileria annulata]|uniref:Structural maintenance of chromosomes protein 5 n=1 Tax=Theileria annulata TaxID=5874 RepID=Q4U9H0_THEAN|nr:chromosome maintenance protein (SMC5 homologue), putative [Theileria annulata]CAI76533.1 chromosome maintenance protein (SMC5 homologue), putative [Theileria annulata]|eukprot:XP_953158.1 chromosome maintenance protein (SMC5 homologue), putative [Theileria annulata]
MRNGSIRYISMENWMAYTGPVVVHSTPGVNIIAASNGSGKSAIVCAIALSLGFDLSILSRADNISSFVKRGCMNSTLKVGLADGDSSQGVVHIERRIFLAANLPNEHSESNKANSSNQNSGHKQKIPVRNEWFLNGKPTNLSNIKSLHKRLNIQLDNLVTFLAQANVGKFAAMTQQQLFRSTLEAIDFKLVDELDNLIDLSQNLKSKVFESKLLQESLNACNKKLSELKIISDTLIKVKDATLYMNIVKLKLNQNKLSNVKKAYETTRKRIGDTNNDIYSHEIKHKKLEAKYNKIKSGSKSLYDLAKNNIEHANKIMQQDNPSCISNSMNDSGLNEPVQKAFYDSLSMLNSFSNDIQRKESRMQISEEGEQTLREKIQSLTEDINSLKSKLSDVDEIVSAIATNKIKEDSIRYNLKKFTSNSYDDPMKLQFEALLKNLSYVKRDMIMRYNRYCEAKSIEPKKFIVNDIKVSGVLNCSIVENLIWNYLDCILLHSSEFDDNLKLIKDFKLPTVTAPERNNVMCKVTDKMKSYGVMSFVHELVTASDLTIQVLSSLCDINEAFIVDEKTYNKIFFSNKNKSNPENLFSEFYKTMLQEISNQIGERVSEIKYFVGNKKHVHKHFYKSNYFMDTEMEISNKPKVIVDFSNFGKDSRNEEMMALENELDEVRSKLYDLNKKLNEQNELNKNTNRKLYTLTKQKLTLEKSLNAITANDNQKISGRSWKHDLNKLKKSRLKHISNSIVDTAKTLMIRIQNASEMKNILIEANESYDEYCSKVVEIDEMSNNVTISKNQLDELKSSLTLLQNTFKEQKERIDLYTNVINDVKQAINDSEQLFESDLFEESTNNFNEVKKRFENKLINLSDSDLEKELIKAEEQVKKLETDDFEEIQLIKMIQDERTQKDKLKQKIYDNRTEVNTATEELNKRYGIWESNVKQLVTEIDYKFGKYMEYIGDGSGGQVRLDVDIDNIQEAKMRILVKFDREKDLLPLTTSYQSGGERGVTTMVYILSVQNLTNNPFFVIDEINQGLDSHYERNLMKLLLASNNCEEDSQNPSTPQYFILTPQLISGYDLSKATLHFPLNGPGIEQNIEI